MYRGEEVNLNNAALAYLPGIKHHHTHDSQAHTTMLIKDISFEKESDESNIVITLQSRNALSIKLFMDESSFISMICIAIKFILRRSSMRLARKLTLLIRNELNRMKREKLI